MELNTTEEIIQEISQGNIVILMDDEDRENEGDLVIAASRVTPESINFMAKYGRGLICLTLTREHCQRLNLPLMASNTYTRDGTNFTISIEAAEGVTTGISAADRALTIQKAVAEDAKPSDLVQPGHIFPLMAHPGGVLCRAGHTEAGCDLTRLAGLIPAAVIVEILNDDGSMARRHDLEKFAKQHNLKIGTIADLIRYRSVHEKTVERVIECELPTEYGDFHLIAYRDGVEDNLHFAMVKGEIIPDKPTLVRVHVQDPICDLTGSLKKECGWPIRDVLQRIAKDGEGVVVILCNQKEPMELIRQLEFYNQSEDQEISIPDRSRKDLRTIGLGSQILADLGVRKLRVLSAPKKVHAISGFDLEIVEYIN